MVTLQYRLYIFVGGNMCCVFTVHQLWVCVCKTILLAYLGDSFHCSSSFMYWCKVGRLSVLAYLSPWPWYILSGYHICFFGGILILVHGLDKELTSSRSGDKRFSNLDVLCCVTWKWILATVLQQPVALILVKGFHGQVPHLKCMIKVQCLW